MFFQTLLLAGIAAASPLVSRQAVDPTDPNAPCGRQPFGYGPPLLTENQFENGGVVQTIATFAPTPKGYSRAFTNADGATSQANYMGYYVLESYNTTQCAVNCNNADGCQGFNIFFERDPLLNPAPACPNPLPTINIKCSIWGSPVSRDTATNLGQYREQFHVLVDGSDGFNKAS